MDVMARVLHPAVYGLYFTLVIIATMVFLQPVCIGCSWLGALLCWLLVTPRKTVRSVAATLGWQALIVVLMTLGNMLFSAHGQVILFTVGTRNFYLESALYGASMGFMLSAVMLWFLALQALLNPDDVRQLGAGVLPTLSLMLSMMLAYYPRLLSRGRSVNAVTSANTAAFTRCPSPSREPATKSQTKDMGSFIQRKREALQQTRLLRTMSVLLGWSLEDSLVQVNSMRARGYGSGKRSSFRSRRWHRRDILAFGVVGIFGGLAGVVSFLITKTFSFYPSWSGLAPWQCYIPCMLFMLLPVVYFLWLRSRCLQL